MPPPPLAGSHAWPRRPVSHAAVPNEQSATRQGSQPASHRGLTHFEDAGISSKARVRPLKRVVNHVAVRDELQDLRGPGRGEDSGVLPDRSTDLGLVVGDVGDVDVGGFGERGECRAPILVAARKGRRGPHLGEELLVQG